VREITLEKQLQLSHLCTFSFLYHQQSIGPSHSSVWLEFLCLFVLMFVLTLMLFYLAIWLQLQWTLFSTKLSARNALKNTAYSRNWITLYFNNRWSPVTGQSTDLLPSPTHVGQQLRGNSTPVMWIPKSSQSHEPFNNLCSSCIPYWQRDVRKSRIHDRRQYRDFTTLPYFHETAMVIGS